MRNLYVRSLAIDWDRIPAGSYLRDIPALRGLDWLDFRQNVTLLTGENGSGKSTLLEAMAVALGFSAEGGTRNIRFSTYDDVSELSEAVRLVRGPVKPAAGFFFRAESFFNVATAIMQKYNDDGQLPDYHAESHGESFLSFMQRADENGIYLMDEPEAALSPQRQLSLLIHIARMARAGAQFIIATHSPILLGIPDAEILAFDGTGVHPCEWDDTESVRVTKLFLESPARMIRMLLSDES